MNLIKQFELKLEQVSSKLATIRKAFKYNSHLILNGLKTIELNDPLRNTFAKHDFTLQETLLQIKKLTNELSIFYNHKEIVLIKDERISLALQLLEVYEDKITDLLTTLQAIAIYLENLLEN